MTDPDPIELETIGVPIEGKFWGIDEKNIVATAQAMGAKRYVLDSLKTAYNCSEMATARVFITFAAFIIRMSLNDEVQHYFRRLINDARPIDDADWGSLRQISAETRLWSALKASGVELGTFQTDDPENNTYELLDMAMQILNTDVKLELPPGERWIGMD